MNQHRHQGFEQAGADKLAGPGTTTPDSRTQGERWLEAYQQDAVAQMLYAIAEAALEGAEAEPDTLLWPEPGARERARLDRRDAALVIGLLKGLRRHWAAANTMVSEDTGQRQMLTLADMEVHDGGCDRFPAGR